MNISLKSVRKLMGWCPNSTVTGTGSQIKPNDYEAYKRPGEEKTDRSGGEKAGNNLNRMKRVGLLLTSIGAFISALTLVLNLKGSISLLMVGVGTLLFLIGSILYLKS